MSDITPLYILLPVMWTTWQADDLNAAVGLAKFGVVYLHPKVSVARPIVGLS